MAREPDVTMQPKLQDNQLMSKHRASSRNFDSNGEARMAKTKPQPKSAK